MVRKMEGAEGKERIGKGEGGLDLDICPGARVPSYATAHDYGGLQFFCDLATNILRMLARFSYFCRPYFVNFIVFLFRGA